MNVFNKIVIISLCDKWTKEIAKTLAQSLDMVFCDTKDLIEYELIDKVALEEISSKEYMDEAEGKVVKHISTFDGVTVSISYDYFSRHNHLLRDNSCFIFLSLTKTFVKENSNPIDYISFDKRTKHLQELSDITIPVRKTDANYVCLKIIERLREKL